MQHITQQVQGNLNYQFTFTICVCPSGSQSSIQDGRGGAMWA